MTETDPVAERPRVHVGLTGGIAAGKSAVARVLQERGALLVDSDALARLVLEKGTDGRITASQVGEVDGEDRLAELARMLSGTASDTALAHARELLEDARVVG